MYNVLICGACGRMGKEVLSRIQSSSELKVVCGFDKIETQELRFPCLF